MDDIFRSLTRFLGDTDADNWKKWIRMCFKSAKVASKIAIIDYTMRIEKALKEV